MSFTTAPQWSNEGVAPTDTLKANGFQAGYKPPATVFNYLFNKYGICFNELQTAVNDKKGTSGTANGSEIFNSDTNEASGIYSHAEGYQTHATSQYAHAEGHQTQATNNNAHAEGENTEASGVSSHAEGNQTHATANHTHAEGSETHATAYMAHAQNEKTTASGRGSHAEGFQTEAKGLYSHASGYQTIANNYQFVTGKYNVEKASSEYAANQDAENSLFIVGYGSATTARANAFRITAAGKCYGAQSFGGSGADYAEYFEWQDGNKNNEDRRGLFVTLGGDKIRLANATDDYIVGVISANPSIIGDVQSENWHGMYKKDVFGQPLTETIEVPESTDEETGEVIPAHTVTKYVVNPDYNPDEEYISREFRKEWACVGLLGKLIVVDDGTCEVNGYCKATDGGKATKADTGYRVMKRIDKTHIQIMYR